MITGTKIAVCQKTKCIFVILLSVTVTTRVHYCPPCQRKVCCSFKYKLFLLEYLHSSQWKVLLTFIELQDFDI